MVPLIETDRLRLREFRQSDLGPQAEGLRDPAVVRYLTGKPHSREDAWRRLVAGSGMWNMLGYGYWCVERVSDGAYLGQIGFADHKRDIEPSIDGFPEMGWVFASHAQGHGYAREAAQAAIGWSDRTLGRQELVAIISHSNAPSIRLAETCGFRIRQEAVYGGEPILLFRRPASPASASAASASSS